MCEQLARKGDRDAHFRKLCLKSLHFVAGRSGELSHVTYEHLKWDPEFNCVFIDIQQVKTAKIKKVVFTAGVDRHADWFIDFGDRLASEHRAPYTPDEYQGVWLFEELMIASSAGSKIGDFVKALMPHDREGASQVKAYSEYTVDALPANASAAGIRAGAANKLFTSVPEPFAITTTGHSANSDGYQKYLDAEIAHAMPGAIVLSGFPKLPFGEMGKCGKPPALDVLFDELCKADSFEDIIDSLYRIHEGSPPMLKRRGGLRPAVHAAFASQVMYYHERYKAGEARDVNDKMRSALMERLRCAGAEVASETLMRWGERLKRRFDRDNLHLTSREKDTGYVQVVEQVRTVAEDASHTRERVDELAHKVDVLVTANAVLQAQNVQLISMVEKLLHSQMPAGAGAIMGTASGSAPRVSADAVAVSEGGAIAANVSGMADPPRNPFSNPPQVAHGGDATKLLNSRDTTSEKANTLAGIYATELYMSATFRKGGSVSESTVGTKQEKGRAKKCLDMFHAMATKDEKEIMNKGNESDRSFVAHKLHGKVVALFKEVFSGLEGKSMPLSLEPKKGRPNLKANAVDDLLKLVLAGPLRARLGYTAFAGKVIFTPAALGHWSLQYTLREKEKEELKRRDSAGTKRKQPEEMGVHVADQLALPGPSASTPSSPPQGFFGRFFSPSPKKE